MGPFYDIVLGAGWVIAAILLSLVIMRSRDEKAAVAKALAHSTEQAILARKRERHLARIDAVVRGVVKEGIE